MSSLRLTDADVDWDYRREVEFLRSHRLDVALVVLASVVFVTTLMGSGGATKIGGIVGGASLLVLIARQWQPLAASVLSFVGLMVAAQVSPKASGAEFFAVLAVFGVAGSLCTRRDAVIAWLIGCLTFGTAMSRNPNVGGASDITLTLAFCSVIWGAGLLAAERGRSVEGERGRAARIEAGWDRSVQEATEQERARIATELHDIVSHGLSVVVVQTVAARMALEDTEPPDLVDRRLGAVESTAREALADMRRLLGLLNQNDLQGTPERTEPSAGLTQLPGLIDNMREAGMQIALDLDGGVDPSPGVAAASYRIVQEALTNVIKHGGDNATVVVHANAAHLVIEVRNTNSAPSGVPTPRSLPGTGRGLIGMRQRAELYGGTFEAGPYEEGFRVLVRIPLPPEATRTRTFQLRDRRKSP